MKIKMISVMYGEGTKTVSRPQPNQRKYCLKTSHRCYYL